jgi:arylsulfatase A-like enzyme
VRNLREWFERRDRRKPFFVFVNFLEAHLPYDPPAGYRDRHLADLPRDRKVSIQWAYEYNAGLHPDSTVNWPEVRELYGGDVHTADALLGEVVDFLREKDLYEQSVIIVTSDHGENIGDHRLMDHQFSVHQTLLAVPLVIRAPDVWPGAGVRNDSVLLTDLYPTILELAGVSADTIRVQGRSLLHADPSGGKARPLFADYSEPSRVLLDLLHKLNPNADLSRLAPAWRTVRVGRFRLTVGSDGTVLLHDVVADPGQKHNLAPEQPETVALLERVLTQSQVATRSEAGGEFEIDAQTREQLRSLGYIQ